MSQLHQPLYVIVPVSASEEKPKLGVLSAVGVGVIGEVRVSAANDTLIKISRKNAPKKIFNLGCALLKFFIVEKL